MVLRFKQWLEDAGEVHPTTNDNPYADKGVASKITCNDKKRKLPTKNPEKLFGLKTRDVVEKPL